MINLQKLADRVFHKLDLRISKLSLSKMSDLKQSMQFLKKDNHANLTNIIGPDWTYIINKNYYCS